MVVNAVLDVSITLSCVEAVDVSIVDTTRIVVSSLGRAVVDISAEVVPFALLYVYVIPSINVVGDGSFVETSVYVAYNIENNCQQHCQRGNNNKVPNWTFILYRS